MELLFFVILLICFFIFVLPLIKQHRLDNTAVGTIISIETETYTGSYGRRYTRQIAVYEFEDFSGKRWRGRTTKPHVTRQSEGSQIPIRYQTTQPSRNDVET